MHLRSHEAAGLLSLGLLGAALLDPTLPAHASQAAVALAPLSADEVLSAAAAKAFRGGAAGFGAGLAQVLCFMWLRTAMNVQMASGGTLRGTLAALWAEGGLARLYTGVSVALVQTPLARFGDAAANVGVLSLFAASGSALPLPLQTACASVAGAAWRLLLAPLDTLKTARQVSGSSGSASVLSAKLRARGPAALYDGALAAAAANAAGSYPWFATYNALQASLPPADGAWAVGRNALIGCAASCVSDTVSNGPRVVKTIRQSSAGDVSYLAAARGVIGAEGLLGLLGRGLRTRLLVNALQGALFSVVVRPFPKERTPRNALTPCISVQLKLLLAST